MPTPQYWTLPSRPLEASSTKIARDPFPFGTTIHEILTNFRESSEDTILAGVKTNPLFHKWYEQMKSSGLYSEELLGVGDAAPLGAVQAAVVEGAMPGLVGRQIATTLRTDDIKVRFYRRKPGRGKLMASGARAPVVGAGYDTVDISLLEPIEDKAEWTREFVEDVPFNVALDEAAEVGRAVAERESQLIFDQLEVAAEAVAHDVTSADTDAWADLSDAIEKIHADNGQPTFVAIPSAAMAYFWKNATFINNFHFGDMFDVATGTLGRSYIGVKVVVSTQLAGGTDVVQLGNERFIKHILRRDLLTESYSEGGNLFGYRASIRMGVAAMKRYKTRAASGLDYWDFGQIISVP